MNGKRKTFAYLGGILILGLIAVAALDWGPGPDVSPPHSTPGTRSNGTARIGAPSLPLAAGLSPTRAGLAPARPAAAPPVLETYARMPLRFESWTGRGRRGNDGDGRGKFLARGAGYSVLLAPTEVVLAVHASAGSTPVAPGFSPAQRLGTHANAAEGTAGLKAGATQASLVRMQLAGANAAAPMRGEGMLPGRVNYYLGNDPKKWRTNVRTYAKVRDEAVYPGIDLVYYGNQGQLEYDFVVAPGADPGAIRLRFEGAEKLEVDAQGDLALRTPAGPIHLRKPVVYQMQSVVRGQWSLATDYGRGTTDNPQSKIENTWTAAMSSRRRMRSTSKWDATIRQDSSSLIPCSATPRTWEAACMMSDIALLSTTRAICTWPDGLFPRISRPKTPYSPPTVGALEMGLSAR